MPFNGNGQFDPASPQYPAIVDTLILAIDWNTIVADLAAGLSLTWTRDGQAGALANLSMGGYKLTTLANGFAPQDAVTMSQISTLQPQLNTLTTNVNLKGTITGQTWTGNHIFTGAVITVATPAAGDNSTKVASTAFVIATAFNAALPSQLGKAGKYIITDGTNASWTDISAIKTPTNVSPAASATGVMNNAVLTGSAYLSLYGLAKAFGQWQVSTVDTFATTVIDSGDVAGTAVSYAMVAGALAVNTAYFWRVRYKDSDGVYSAYSAPTSFTTAAVFTSYIATPTATPAAFGDSFEGGFYTGMIWNELMQSATSFLIGTGSKSFTVADMTATPLVYSGQTLEVRSRANPANRMIGVVTFAGGTTLTINVTSVVGSGTFTDWSVMAQYRVIVAPKATGENTSIAFKNTADAAPSACGTLTEGRKATLAMVAAGSSTVYPAAHFCNNLSIASRTDWYLPARDELELCWRNLKPTADSNYVVADRPVGATPNYMNLGSYGDTANTHGLNNNSSPTAAAYSAGTPAQVAAGKNFRTSESEAFFYVSTVSYWSASEYSTTQAWYQEWRTATPGAQAATSVKTATGFVRAVRRSII